MANDFPPQLCRICPSAHNAVNGRYCDNLQRYIQRLTIPPCYRNTPNNNS